MEYNQRLERYVTGQFPKVYGGDSSARHKLKIFDPASRADFWQLAKERNKFICKFTSTSLLELEKTDVKQFNTLYEMALEQVENANKR